jgi:hypothetical protein
VERLVGVDGKYAVGCGFGIDLLFWTANFLLAVCVEKIGCVGP